MNWVRTKKRNIHNIRRKHA